MLDRKAFYAALRKRSNKVFGTRLTQTQVNGIEGILDAFETHGDGRIETLAYALATARWEVGKNMVPVREGFAKTDAGARRAVASLARRRGPKSPPARYGASTPPYGHAYYGRGHVQLTWKSNYERSSKDAGVDLVKYPDKMLDPVVSARVLIKGLIDGRWNGHRKGIAHYLPSGRPGDLRNARRTVNVTDKWQKVAGFYEHFLTALKAASFGNVATQPKPAKPTVDLSKSEPPKTKTVEAKKPPAPERPTGSASQGADWLIIGLFILVAIIGIALGAISMDEIQELIQ